MIFFIVKNFYWKSFFIVFTHGRSLILWPITIEFQPNPLHSVPNPLTHLSQVPARSLLLLQGPEALHQLPRGRQAVREVHLQGAGLEPGPPWGLYLLLLPAHSQPAWHLPLLLHLQPGGPAPWASGGAAQGLWRSWPPPGLPCPAPPGSPPAPGLPGVPDCPLQAAGAPQLVEGQAGGGLTVWLQHGPLHPGPEVA